MNNTFDTAFSKLHELYSIKLKSEGISDTYILTENNLRQEGEAGVYAMLAMLYKNQEKSPSLFDPPKPETTDPSIGLDKQVCELASICLNREVTKEDKQVLFNIRAVRHELSEEAFDKLTDLLSKK